MEHHIEGENYFLVGLAFETLETPGVPVRLEIILDSAQQRQDPRTLTDKPGVVLTESHAGFRGPATLVFPAKGPRYVVPRGHLSYWIVKGD
jgi:hypothetical protein